MAAHRPIKFFTLLLFLLTITGFCFSSFAEAQTMYTAQNLWYRSPKKVFAINYKTGNILQAGTRVDKIKIKEGRRPYIQFRAVDQNIKFTVYMSKRYYPKTSISQLKRRLFTTKDFSTLTSGLTATEIKGIKTGSILNNMSKKAVLIAYGYPPEHKTPSLGGSKWIYWRNKFRSMAINFDNNNLARINISVPNKRIKSIVPVQTARATVPKIRIIEPALSRGLTLSKKRITVRGTATDPDGIFEVVVNGKEASLNSDGTFESVVLLGVGENTIRIMAVDTQSMVAQKSFTINREGRAAPVQKTVKKAPSLKPGTYHALIIAVQEYPHPSINSLDHPIEDANALRKVLIANYTFSPKNVIFLKNPERETIIQKFDLLSKKVAPEDSLLIFYAGHGYWDKRFRQGYWFPNNASKNNRSKWISNSTIVDFIRGIQSNHTLLVADACFSGGIFKTRKAFSNASPAINQMNKLPSRKAITSGTLNEVPDKSVFVEYLIKRLGSNSKSYLPSEQLFINFRTAVINNSPINQVPQFGEIRQSGDEGGDFIFIKK